MASDTPIAELGDLTLKQAAFLDAYLTTGNASEAYRQAYDVAGMLPATINHEATDLLAHPAISPLIAARRAAASAAVDLAILSARLGAPGNLARLDRIAALAVDGEEADPRKLPSIKGAAETLLTIAEVIPKAGVTVDARSVTVNIGARDERLTEYTTEELRALADELARRAGHEAVEAP